MWLADVPWEGKNFLHDNCCTCIFLFYSRKYAEIIMQAINENKNVSKNSGVLMLKATGNFTAF